MNGRRSQPFIFISNANRGDEYSVPASKSQGQFDLVAAPVDGERYIFSRALRSQQVAQQFTKINDLAAIDMRDQVPNQDPGLVGRPTGRHGNDISAGGLR